MKQQLASLFEYGDWVNQRLLKAAEALTEEEFGRKVLPGFGSVHLTFVHLLGAERLWFERWQGRSPKTMLAAEAAPTVHALREQWVTLVAERRAFFEALDEADVMADVSWTNMRGQAFTLPLWQIMLHCANHSTHHRSEIATMLTMLGREPEGTDLLEYYLQQAGVMWRPTDILKRR